MPEQPLKPAIQITNGHATTTSLRIAEHFGKKHFHVLRAIKNLDCSPEFRASNFGFMSRPVKIGNGAERTDSVCTMTRDGFMFLAMGFTGKEAAQWKEAYINAFNAMEAEIAKQQQAQQAAAALPVITQADLEMLKRIDKRAWQYDQEPTSTCRTVGTDRMSWQSGASAKIRASIKVVE